MPGPKVSEAEFIRIWNELKSTAKVAKALDMDKTAVRRRRKRIRSKTGKDLQVDPYKPIVELHPHRITYDFSNGVVIAFSDAHFWPKIYTTAYRCLLEFIDWLKPKAVVCNGDAFDGASISRHPPIGWESLPTVLEELEAVEEHLAWIEAISRKAALFWTLGNHDSRYETRLATTVPEFRGVKNFHLKDHFPKWAPAWSVWINDTVFKHRLKGGIHAAWNNTLWAGKSIATGHLHQGWYRGFRDYNGLRWGIDLGTLADVEGPQFVDYTEDNPKTWVSGFFVLTYKNGQLLQPEHAVVVEEGIVHFRGKEIKV